MKEIICNRIDLVDTFRLSMIHHRDSKGVQFFACFLFYQLTHRSAAARGKPHLSPNSNSIDSTASSCFVSTHRLRQRRKLKMLFSLDNTTQCSFFVAYFFRISFPLRTLWQRNDIRLHGWLQFKLHTINQKPMQVATKS